MKKKTRNIMITTAAAVLLGVGGGWYLLHNGSSESGEGIYVQKISELNGTGVLLDRFSGVVEAQDSVSVKKDYDKEIEEIFVEEGDAVKQGDALFKYSTTESQKNYELAQLNLEEIDNEISALTQEVRELEAQKNRVSEDEKFEYTTEISAKQTQIRQYQYDRQTKQKEMESYRKAINNATVYCTINGTVEAINENGGYDNYGNEKPFMSITQTGEFRVKGKLDEMSMGTIMSGQNVVVRSRVNENDTWTGMVTEVQMEPDTNQNEGWYGGGESSSKYPFYVTLNYNDGLMLGQHVFIEPDYGQGNVKDGVWLDPGFVAYAEDTDDNYVWVSVRNKLKKQKVELGEMDEETWRVEILSGVTADDYIAWPDDSLTEGQKTVSAEDLQG